MGLWEMQLLVMLTPLAAWAYFALALRTPAHGAAMHIRVRHTRSALRWALTGVLGAACGFGFGLWVSFSAIAGSDVDPSQKARILAEGISEAINCSSPVVVASATACLAALWLRTRNARRASSDAI